MLLWRQENVYKDIAANGTMGGLISCIFISEFLIWLLNATKLGSKAMCLHDRVLFHNT